MSELAKRLEGVREKIEAAARRGGRDPSAIEIMAVTKTLPFPAVDDAINAGITLIGENRVQEALSKFPEQRPYRLHLIGHLQRNKAKLVPGFFDCVESIDKTETAAALERYCKEYEKTVDILLEVNTSGEESKGGFRSVEPLKETIDAVMNMEWIRLSGLMTVAPFTDDLDAVRRSFAALRSIFEEVRGLADRQTFITLSMGMSADYEIAVEEGSTRVRLGTVLFGKRR